MNYTYLIAGAGIGGMTYYTYKNPTILMPYVVRIIQYYHIITDYYYGNETNNETIKRKHSSINLICYDTKTKEEQITQNIKEATENKQIDNKTFDLKMIEKTIDNVTYYKRLYEEDLNNLIKDNHFFLGFLDEKPFLQVSFDDGIKKIDIHLELKPFFIDRSRILDNKFLIWFMDKYFNYDIVNDYQLNIIDNNVNMVCLNKTDYIVLRNDLDDKYEIIRNEII
tara:strand:+ start:3185 stop:3856 length:672 start_codon:yes stop_codon:yes gene_type:complete